MLSHLHALLLLCTSFVLLYTVYGIADSEYFVFRGPQLTSFLFDRNYGELRLTFDQEIVADSLDIRSLQLQGNASSEDIFYFQDQVHNNLTEQGNATEVFLYMSTDDYARLVVEPIIASSAMYTYISYPYNSCRSSYGDPCEQINTTSAFPVTSYLNDTSQPYVKSFNLNMDTGALNITFSEPMDINTFTLNGLALQSRRNGLYVDSYYALVDTAEDDCSRTVDNLRVILCFLGTRNMNNIKATHNISTTMHNTYLSAYQSFATDTAGNPVSIEAFERIFGMKVDEFVPDLTSPEIVSWDININRETITLHFSETVYMPFFNYSKVIICSASTIDNSIVVLRLDPPIVQSVVNTADVVIQVNHDQFNVIKFSEELATSVADAFLVLEEDLVTDTSAAQNKYQGIGLATPNNALQLGNYTLDTIQPELLYSKLNMTDQTLTLIFSETVDISSMLRREFAIQSHYEVLVNTETVFLSAADVLLTPDDSDVLVFRLDSSFIKMKSFDRLGQSLKNTYIAFTYKFITDMNNNYIVDIPYSFAAAIDEYVPDLLPPEIVSWSLDMNDGTLSMVFTEPMDPTTFQLNALHISDSSEMTQGTTTVTMSPSSTITSRVYNRLNIALSYQDINKIKKSGTVCKSVNTCQLTFSSSLGFDVATEVSISGDVRVYRNSVVALDTPLAVDDLVDDSTPPTLLSYALNMNNGHVILTFSEPVDVQSVRCSQISFFVKYEGGVSVEKILSFSDNCFVQAPTPFFAEMLTIISTRSDFFTWKSLSGISSTTQIFFSFHNDSFVDATGTALDGMVLPTDDARDEDGMAIRAPAAIIADKTAPRIAGYRIDKTIAVYKLFVYFDDVIDVSSVDLSLFTIASFESIETLSLAGSTLVTSVNASSVLEIDIEHLRTTLSSMTINSNQKNSFIRMKTAAVTDIHGNPNVAVSASDAVRVGGAPLYFRLDMTSASISTARITIEVAFALTFASVRASDFSLVDSSSGQSYALTGYSNLVMVESTLFSFDLTSTDVTALKSRSLIKERSLLKLNIKSTAIVNTATSRELTATRSLTCVQLTPDSVGPVLLSYTLTMGTGVLRMVFSKPLKLSTIVLSKLSLVNGVGANIVSTVDLSTSRVLTTGSAASSISVNISASSTHPTDRDRVHLSQSIATSLASTYLVVNRGFALDTSIPALSVAEITVAAPMQASSLTADTTLPRLEYFDINLNARTIKLVFTEAVNAAATYPSYFTVLSSPNNILTNLVTLTDSTISAATLSFTATREVVIDVSDNDMDAIMSSYPVLCSSVLTTFISFDTGATRDLAVVPNNIFRVFKVYAIRVRGFVGDTVKPKLSSFDVTMEDGEMTLRFDEMVQCGNVDVSQILFQARPYAGTSLVQYRLRADSSYVLDCPEVHAVVRQFTIKFGAEDFTLLKSFPQLVKSSAYTYLRLLSGSVMDAAGNDIEVIRDGSAMHVATYTRDSVSPRLLSYSVSRHAILTLRFNEPVNPKSIVITRLVFISALGLHASKLSYTLTSATSLVHTDVYQRIVKLSLTSDFDNIVVRTPVFETQSQTYLKFDSSFIKDTSGNSIVALTDDDALNIGPSVVRWDMNVNAGTITLYFSEIVVESFSLRGVRLQNAAISPTNSITLTASDDAPLETRIEYSASIVTMSLHDDDLRPLKLSGMLNQYGYNLYLHVDAGLTNSSTSGTVIPTLQSIATQVGLPITSYTHDTSGPMVQYVVVNLERSFLSLTFNEPVRGVSVDASSIALLSNAFGHEMSLSGTDNVLADNATTIILNITSDDLNAIKYAHAVGTLDKLLLNVDAVEDLFGNNLLGDEVFDGLKLLVPIDEFVEDMTSPSLISFTIDLNTNIMYLTFDELIQWNSLIPEHMILYSTSNMSDPLLETFEFSNYTIVETDAIYRSSVVEVNLGLFRLDAFRLQEETQIGRSVSTTHLQLSGVQDVFGNIMILSPLVQCDSITPDNTRPVVEGFDVSYLWDSGASDVVINYYFSEVVNISSFLCSDFLLASQATSNPGEIISFLDTNCTMISEDNTRQVNFTVSADFFSGVIGTDVSNTYMFTTALPSTSDMYGNIVSVIGSNTAIRVGPTIVKHLLDMNRQRADIVYSYHVVLSSFDASIFGYYSTISQTNVFLESTGYALEPFSTTYNGLTSVTTLILSDDDMNRLKRGDVKYASTYVIADEGAIEDANGLPSIAVSNADALLPDRFIDDNVSPVLLSITVDMSRETITFVFNEPIRLSSIQPKKIILLHQNGTLDSVLHHRLTGGTILETNDVNTEFTLQMLLEDAGSIKLTQSLATSLNSTYLAFEYNAMEDYAGNSLRTLLPESARQVDAYVEDVIAPKLLYFDLDMSLGLLVLQFNEPIDASTVDVTQFILQRKFAAGKSGLLEYALTSTSVVVSNSGFLITIQISTFDIIGIQKTPQLARRRINSYLRASSSAAADLNLNNMRRIIDGEALPCRTFIADTKRPRIVSVSLNWLTEQINFVLSEPVITKTVQIHAVTIQDAPSNPKTSYTFTTSSNTLDNSNEEFTSSLYFKISKTDRDNIKWRTPLGLFAEHTFFAVKSFFCTDVSLNAVQEISALSAQRVASLTSDSIPPVVSSYTLDMNLMLLKLSFTETVVPSSVNLTQLFVQRTETRRFGPYVNFNWSTVAIGDAAQSGEMVVTIDHLTEIEMKYGQVGYNMESSWVSWGDRFITDGSGVYMLPLWDASVSGYHPQPPNALIVDTTPPKLVNWFADRESFNIHFEFSEPITIVDFGGMTLYNDTAALLTFSAECQATYDKFNTRVVVNVVDVSCSDSCDTSTCLTDALGNELRASDVVDLLLQNTTGPSPDLLYLQIDSTAVQDFSSKKNTLADTLLYISGGPDCSPCPQGTFLSADCTSSADRVCSTCSTCGLGKYQHAACTSEHDTRCADCSTCPYGMYISSACSATSDTRCDYCTACKQLQYEKAECTAGSNAICDSCKLCSFTNITTERACVSEKYLYWRMENCCVDELGRTVRCDLLDWSNMQIAARNGRHHKMFEGTSPPVNLTYHTVNQKI